MQHGAGAGAETEAGAEAVAYRSNKLKCMTNPFRLTKAVRGVAAKGVSEARMAVASGKWQVASGAR